MRLPPKPALLTGCALGALLAAIPTALLSIHDSAERR